MKRCRKCGVERSTSEFRPRPRAKDGLYPYCDVCNRASAKEWYDRNLERARASARTYRDANRAAAIARSATWKRDNPERWRALRRKHKWLRKKGVDSETATYVAVLLNDPCSYCGGPASTVDHIVPLDAGGLNHWTNMTASCFRCNQSKRTRSMLIWFSERRWERWAS